MEKISPFLMFDGCAEEAINFYTGIFSKSDIKFIKRYLVGEAGTPGKVEVAVFSLNGQEFKCIDSVAKHDFTFTPALSLFVECETEKEIDEAFEKLADGGEVFMPLTVYPFSNKFGWVADKFGVSWQLAFNT
ncbi:MAG: VOC family protein [Ferruginibacter sp.]